MRKPFYKILYVQALTVIAIGVLLDHYSPELAVKIKPLGDDFIQLIKVVIDPIIFCTVVSGIANTRDVREMGHVGGKALFYFEVVSTFALIIGPTAGHIFNPDADFNIDVNTIDAKAVTQYAAKVRSTSTADFLLNIIPSTMVDAFAKGDILQILLIALLFEGALSAMGEHAQMVTGFIDQTSHVFFRIVYIITRMAPIGAFGAMAFTIGKHGVISLVPLPKLVSTFYFATIIFVVVMLDIIARVVSFNIFHFITYIRKELLIVLGTNSSKSALSHLMEKIEELGYSRSVVGLVVPTGYSFNLDDTNIYMTIAVILISQALSIELTQTQQPTILAVAMLTSKGASGITDAGFITLTTTLTVVPGTPVASIVLILGIGRFMNECRAPTNITGNGVTYVVISAWERELDRAKLVRMLLSDRSDGGIPAAPAV